MTSSARVPGPSGDGREGTSSPRLRRRRYLIAPSHQIRVGGAAVGITLVLLVLLDVSLFLGGEDASDSARDRVVETGLIAAGSLVFLAGVFAVSVLETHRTVGAAKSLRATLERFRAGRWEERARLRRGDNLRDVASAFNALAGELHERRRAELQRLEELADMAERESSGVSRELRRLVEERRQEFGPSPSPASSPREMTGSRGPSGGRGS